jgi:hypothetical protein
MQVSTTSLRARSAGISARPCALAWKRSASAAARAGVRLATLLAQRLERELDHLARADQQRMLVFERVEDLRREVDADARDRDRALGDLRLVAHALRRGEGALVEPPEDRPAGADLDRCAVGVLHLAQDLRLPDHLRVAGGSDAEGVAHGGRALELVERGVELLGPRALLARRELALEQRAQAQARRVGVARHDQRLDAVAGREQHALVDVGARHQLAERGARVVDREALAQLEGRGAVAHADEQELHGAIPAATTTTRSTTKPAADASALRRAPGDDSARMPTTAA